MITPSPCPRRLLRRNLQAAAAALSLLLAAAAQAQLPEGSAAPDFSVTAALGGKAFAFKLSEARQKGPVVVYFYPKAFTKGCTLEARAFAEAADDYAALGASVIGISGDDMATLAQFSVSECSSRFAVGSDADGKVMQAYQAAMRPGANVAQRISYVITPAGEVAYSYAASDYEKHVPNTLAAIRAWQQGEKSKQEK